jgi:hypothetical protein
MKWTMQVCAAAGLSDIPYHRFVEYVLDERTVPTQLQDSKV